MHGVTQCSETPNQDKLQSHKSSQAYIPVKGQYVFHSTVLVFADADVRFGPTITATREVESVETVDHFVSWSPHISE